VLFLVTFFAQAKTVTPSGERAQASRTRRPRAVAAAKKRLNVRHRFRGKSRPRLRCGGLSLKGRGAFVVVGMLFFSGLP